MRVIVTITLKPGVLDPEARAIESALAALGFNDASGVSTGKQIALDIDAPDAATAKARAGEMCEALLVNTVIEDYAIAIGED